MELSVFLYYFKPEMLKNNGVTEIVCFTRSCLYRSPIPVLYRGIANNSAIL